MKITKLHIDKEDAFKILLPQLIGKVFHVTKENNWNEIQSSKKILPKPDPDKYTKTFGTKSYFQRNNYVCLFDYRNFYGEKQQQHYHKCLPTKPLEEEHPIYILFLNEAHYSKLHPYSREEYEENCNGTNIVPYVECGFKNEVPINYIDEALKVTLTEDKNSLPYILKKARTKANG